MVTKGCTSAYTTWIKMNKEYGENEFSYKNIGKRFVRLANRDLIEEIKLETVENLHGRKDYRVTMKGLDSITRYFLTRPDDMQILVEYMNKFGLDKSLFAVLLNQGHALTIEALNVFQGLTGTLFNPTKDIHIESEASLKKATRIQEEYETVYERLVTALRFMENEIERSKASIRDRTIELKSKVDEIEAEKLKRKKKPT